MEGKIIPLSFLSFARCPLPVAPTGSGGGGAHISPEKGFLNMSKKILLLSTGGTIASAPTEHGLAPAVDGRELLSRIAPSIQQYQLESEDVLNLDSSNIQPEEWQVIARRVYQRHLGYDGIVITHGTDTMAYTASALSFMLPQIPIPVVFTGSQLPLADPLSDAWENLRDAFAMAASGQPGIFLCFNRKVSLGCRAVKVRTTGFDAFESVNCPYAAKVDSRGLRINPSVVRPAAGLCQLKDQLDCRVILIKLTPGFNPDIFDMLLGMDYRGIVIEAFGIGGLHFIHRDLVSKLQKVTEAGISVVVCSQCLYEASDFSVYETGKRILEKGVIQGRDMTSVAAVTKLIWALGQTQDPGQVRALFETDLAGEITLD